MGKVFACFTLCLLSSLLVALTGKAAAAGEPAKSRDETGHTLDHSDPKKTYETYLRAIKANNLEDAKKCWFFADGDPAGALDVLAGLWVTAHRLSEVARNKLGVRGWGVLQEWNNIICRSDCTNEAIDRTLQHLKDANVKTTGDKATLTIKWAESEPLEKPVFGFAGDDPVARFRRVNGQWKLDASTEVDVKQPADFFAPGGWGQVFRDQIQATQRIIGDLEKGNLRTDEETIAAFEASGKENGTQRKPRKLGPRLDQVGVASAVHLESGGLAMSTSHPPVLAVSESGVIYVFWPAQGLKNAGPSPELPMIPARFSFGDYPGSGFSEVPGVNVCRGGAWSKPGVLVEGKKLCCPCFAWCAGETLHVLVPDAVTGRTQHVTFDPQGKRWDKVAELPYRLTEYDAFRQVGETVHVGFAESSGRTLGEGTTPEGADDRLVYPEHTYASYLSFDGHRWSKPFRIEQSDNRSRHATRVRLAVDAKGTAHLAWWSGAYGYAMIRDGKAVFEPLQFADAAIERDEFDLGIRSAGMRHHRVQGGFARESPGHPEDSHTAAGGRTLERRRKNRR